MRKRIFAKLIFMTFLTFASIPIFCSNVNAESIDKILEEDAPIMVYDCKTGETKRVDMEELRKKIDSSTYIQDENSIRTINNEVQNNRNTSVRFENLNSTRGLYSAPTTWLPGATLITNVKDAPYKYICRAVFQPVGDLANYGTASLVAPKLALTAAHCIWNEDNQYSVWQDWTIYPGYYENTYLNGKTGWSKVYYDQRWMTEGSREYDWALCELNNELGVGYFQVKRYTINAGYWGKSVSAVGYPGDQIQWGFDIKARYPYKVTGKIGTVHDNWFDFSAYSASGMSGGPVYEESDGCITGVLVASTQDSSTTYAVKITSQMIDIINSYLPK